MTRTALALPLAVIVFAGCGSSSSSSSPDAGSSTSASASSSAAAPTSAGSGPAHVVMKSLAFNPDTIQAKVGQTVDWVNQDTAPHNVTYVSGPKFTSSGTLNSGGKFHIKLTQPGTIHYFCSIHPFMKASIVVSR